MLAVLAHCHASWQACPKPPFERSFNSLVEGLFREGSMPPGDVLDVGAHKGEWSCLYACADPSRVVHAVDPSPELIRRLECTSPNIKNVRKAALALAAKGGYNISGSTTRKFVDPRLRPSGRGMVPVTTVDELFGDSPAGFLHIDVEGHEVKVLLGGGRVISRDRPIFSVEVFLREKRHNEELFEHVTALQYTPFVVHEVCGWASDCRNVLCLPNERLRRLADSAVLDLAVRAGVLVQGNPRNISEYVSPAPLRGFYDTTPALLNEPGQYTCNVNGRVWNDFKPCSTANTLANGKARD